MSKSLGTLLLACGLAVASAGCVVVADDHPIPLYEVCDFDFPEDCSLSADDCVPVEVPFGRYRGAFDYMCTRYCTDHSDCPGGLCFDLESGSIEGICYQACDFHSDCTAGWGCYTADDGWDRDSICLPN